MLYLVPVKRNRMGFLSRFRGGGMTITELYRFLSGFLTRDQGWVFGFADLRGLVPETYLNTPYAVTLIRKLDDAVMDGVISNGPTVAYRELYYRVNGEIEAALRKIADYFTAEGIVSVPLLPTVSDHELDEQSRKELSSLVSHKMAATRAGLGWVGKTDLLVSSHFGTRARLGTILTEMELAPLATPVEKSRCVDCPVCVRACPAQAANGVLWDIHTHRDSYFDAHKCRAHCREITMKNLGESESLCGVCVAVCPYQRKREEVA